MTPGGLRAAIARAVIDVAPGKARKRREDAAKDARVQRWAEDSGNAALMGRELPPAEVLAADQRITAWPSSAGAPRNCDPRDIDIAARHLGAARTPARTPAGRTPAAGRTADRGIRAAGRGQRTRATPPGPWRRTRASAAPAGVAGRITLTIPLATLLGLAERPGEIGGIGPIDPALARDLAGAAATPRPPGASP